MADAQKREFRDQALKKRRALENRSLAGEQILNRLRTVAEVRNAGCIFSYVHSADEAPTLPLLTEFRSGGKTVAIPFCVNAALHVFRFEDVSDLAPGSYGIQEPSENVRRDAARRIDPVEIDVAFVPGVAFDRSGNRLGYGLGYFDRFLATLRPDAIRIGLAFREQLCEQVPTESHDLGMDLLVTEDEVIRITKRTAS